MADRRDKNEAKIIALIREHGGDVIQLPPGAGADIVFTFMDISITALAEIKNPEYPITYTEAEKARKKSWRKAGGLYYEWRSIEQAKADLGLEMS